jgi:quinoprotein glucose dehydrogenase
MTTLGLIPPTSPDQSDMNYISGTARPANTPTPAAAAPNAGGEGEGAPGLNVQGLPIFKPPYGQITAIDMGKGEILWQVAHGETPDNIRNNPALKGVPIPRTGRPGVFGVLVTKTLVIAGETGFFTNAEGKRGALLRAYDKSTGKDAGAVYIPAGQGGTPMTYSLNGRQYITVAISGPGFPAELISYRLPAN